MEMTLIGFGLRISHPESIQSEMASIAFVSSVAEVFSSCIRFTIENGLDFRDTQYTLWEVKGIIVLSSQEGGNKILL